MANILLDYLFKISTIEPAPAASTAFLKQACVIAKPKDGGVTAGVITQCSTMAAVNLLVGTAAAAEIQQLFTAGLAKVYVLPMNSLDIASAISGHEADFYTILVSSDFADADVTLAKATGQFVITSYANLLTSTPDTISVAGQAFTAQGGAAVLGAATFQAATSNTATAASLVAQINAHAVTSPLVVASVNASDATKVDITAKAYGVAGNAIALAYTDNGGGNIGATKSGTVLSGGAGLLKGNFVGVVGVASHDDTYLAVQAAIANRSAWHAAIANGAQSMFYGFGKLLSNSLDWKNQQYIPMPVAEDTATLGAAEALFDSKISFVIADSEFSNRLALFAAGGKAIVAPYIERNLQIDMQSEALTYISGNQPGYTHTQAALLEDELKSVIQDYRDVKAWIEDGTVSVTLDEDNFVASSNINIAEPGGLWRIFGEMRASL